MKALPVLLCFAAAPGIACAAVPAAQLAASCAACHRVGADIPPVFGHDEKRIEQAMLSYQADSHGSQIMHVVATALSREEITAISHYLAGPP